MLLKKHFNSFKGIFAILILSFITYRAMAQAPANDNCVGAITLNITPLGGDCPTTVYTNVGATDATGANNSPNPTCYNGLKGFKDVWFKFTTSATGSQNFYVDIQGVNTADSIKNPQAALFIGDCAVGLFEEYCQTQVSGRSGRSLRLEGANMRANTTYYLQVANFQSATAGGQFTVCVRPFEPVYIISATEQSSSTSVGILYDSGGPNSNYTDSEKDFTFNIRPNGTGCIEISIDSLGTEPNYDTLTIFDGRTGELLDRVSGTINQALVFQVPTNWVQIKFNSDVATNSRGFKISWRTLSSCNAPKATTCSAAEIIPSFPFRRSANTCNDKINSVEASSCASDEFLEGKDHVFKITSNGAQCVKVTLTNYMISSTVGFFGRPTGINVGVYRGCPSSTSGECIAVGKSNILRDTISIGNARLEIPGDYYIVVSRREACTPFTIQIDTTICLNRLPNAGFCDKALSLNDCSSTNPSDIALDLSSQGDSTFIRTEPASANAGCIGGLGFLQGIDTPRFNFVFLSFKAQASGKFSFTVSSITDNPNSDIDFNLYGPINSKAEICTFAKNNRPIRSSFGIEKNTVNRATGMLDFYISNRGLPVVVSDTCEEGLGDGVVRTLTVEKDKYYLIWLNDYDGTIGTSGVRLSFAGTAPNVFNLTDPLSNFTAGRDTFLFPGRSAKLSASGGIGYTWTPPTGLDNPISATPTASPTVSTKYNVSIQGVCLVVPKIVNVLVFNVLKIPNQTVCKGEELVFNAGESFPPAANAVWSWTSSTGHLSELSCTNCNSPNFKATNTSGGVETHTFTVTLTTPAGVLSETFTITVTPGTVANYQVITAPKVSRDSNICIGTMMSLLKSGFDNTANYTWSSRPVSTITDKNPSVSPTVSTKYYVTVTGGVGGCTANSLDSVILNVYQPPILATIKDTTLCFGNKLVMGTTAIEEGVTYSWSPTLGLDKTNVANPILTVAPNANTYVLTAKNAGSCETKSTIKATGVNLAMNIDGKDTIQHCAGTPLTLKSTTTPANTPVRWSSDRDFSVKDSAVSVSAMPLRVTRYFATVALPGCIRRDTLTVLVDSLPFDTKILPKDTTVCKGTEVLFYSPTYEPYLFPKISFKWLPKENQLTSDTLYNLVYQADTTRFLFRTATNGVCIRKDSMKIIVNPIPTLTLLPKDTTFCFDNRRPVLLTATTNLPLQTKDWKWKDPNGQDIPEGKDKQSITVNPTQASSTYTVTAKIGDCPGSAMTTITLLPSPGVAFPANDVLCSGQSVTLNLDPRAAWTYNWTSTPAGFTSTSPEPTVTPAATTTYTVTTKSPNGCTSTQSKEYKVATGSLTASPDVSACTGNPVTLTATGTTNIGGTYSWNTGQTSATISPTVSSSTNYAVTFTYGDNAKCTLTKSIRVTALDGFTVRINPDTFSLARLIDQGTQINLNATLGGNYTNPTFAWTNNNKPDVTTQTASIKATESSHIIQVKVTSATGCTAMSQVVVTVRFPGYEIPNAFTPNGDATNAYFNIEFDPENKSGSFSPTNARPKFWKGNIVVESFQVFSRWGGVVYEEKSQSVLNDKAFKGWDGKKGGTDVPSDVYVYIIKLLLPDGTSKAVSGELNLIR